MSPGPNARLRHEPVRVAARAGSGGAHAHAAAPLRESCRCARYVLERLCLAVDFVHSKGFVLVDLKPQNVVIFGSLLGARSACGVGSAWHGPAA